MSEKKKGRSLGSRLTALILFMAATLSTVTVMAGYQIYKGSMERQYIEYGRSLASIVAGLVDADSIDRYLDTMEKDEAYERMLRRIRMMKKESGAVYMSVIKPDPEAGGCYYVFDSDESEDHFDLGYFEPWREDQENIKSSMYNGESVAPVMWQEEWGLILTIYEPIYGASDDVKGYVDVDYSMDNVAFERRHYLMRLVIITVCITVFFAALYVYVIRRSVVLPLSTITKAADEYLVRDFESENGGAPSSISAMVVRTNDELQRLADAMKSMEHKIKEYISNLSIVTVKAETDALTGLWNRDTFRQRVELYLRDNLSPGGVDAFLMIDVDYFKEVNDTFGHITGDTVLVECAQAMKYVMRDSDLIARQGGDEFVIFCKSIGGEAIAENKARQVCEVLRKIFPRGSGKHITASIGVSIAPRDGSAYEELFKTADSAMYKAKKLGRDRYVVYSGGQGHDAA
ncbi:MAG: diguanylate cyclase [Synergistaceae bacterium]|jgi:diguanylate cyclase (GGDEF)-like protein|nr:diguanylate cyclase [Synergistaceae bacterium]